MPDLPPRRVARIGLALCAALIAPRMAAAHFVLHSPTSWREQNVLGDPQKLGPCGDEGTAAATGVVTAFAPGETIMISLDEPIFHPGHYRVALAVNDRSELPPPPPVTPGATPCGSVPIMTPAVFPVLADGMLQHTEPFSGTQSFQVTLPLDVTCTHCTLQVLEFMSDHAAPCFYHHCADLSIGAGGGACGTDAECADDDACTRDACDPEQGCVNPPIALADVASGFLDVPPPPSCSTEQVPAAVGRLVGKADTLVNRASQNPAKAGRLLDRAAKRLRRAAEKVTKAQRRRISTECGAALITALGQAEIQVQCLFDEG